MKAIVQDEYGSPDVLKLREVPKPEIGDDDVLLRVHAASVNPADWHIMRGEPRIMRLGFGFRKPKGPTRGIDVAGTVEAVGKDVKELRPGDEVFGVCDAAFAEYAVAKENRLGSKPKHITFEQAAAIPVAAHCALQALRNRGKVRPGQRVLINGASGGVGTFTVQIAKTMGAHVTGVCSSRNVDLVRSLGADEVIDYTKEDFTRAGERYDFILDNAGNHSLTDIRRALTRTGTLIPNNGDSGLGPLFRVALVSPFVRQKLRPFLSKENKDDLVALKELIEAGEVKPVIDRIYELKDVPEAMRYLEEGHVRGKVVITV
ncbi:MAG: NAD(P)-dependent alcohol dehydrogenase [Actinomycetota bacterium]